MLYGPSMLQMPGSILQVPGTCNILHFLTSDSFFRTKRFKNNSQSKLNMTRGNVPEGIIEFLVEYIVIQQGASR